VISSQPSNKCIQVRFAINPLVTLWSGSVYCACLPCLLHVLFNGQ
jgi:hypothetical protein